MSSIISWKLALSSAAAGMLLCSSQAFAVDWAKVPATDIALFYPAQISMEKLVTKGRHSGGSKFLAGKNCFACHGNIDERSIGGLMVDDPDNEPKPIVGKPSFVNVKVKVAHDTDKVYINLDFDPGKQPNSMMDKEFETKVALMIDDGAVPEVGRAGCYAVCHDNLNSMPSAREETTKYVSASRVVMSPMGGSEIKPQADIDKLHAAGGFIEYWQARLKPGAKAVPVDGWILEKRTENKTPAVATDATQNGTAWSVTFSRKLKGAGENHKDIVPGKIYNVGFSIHAGYTQQRFHYVSLERTLVLDEGKADFVAAKQ